MLDSLAHICFIRSKTLLIGAGLVSLIGCSTGNVVNPSPETADNAPQVEAFTNPSTVAQPESSVTTQQPTQAIAVQPLTSQPSSQSPSQPSSQPPSQPESSNTSQPEDIATDNISVDLVPGRQYADARNQLIQQGWVPADVPEPGPYGVERMAYEAGFTEVTACSGTGLGHCHFLFTHTTENKVLAVITANGASLEVFDWDVSTPVDGDRSLSTAARTPVNQADGPEVVVIPAAFQGEWHGDPAYCTDPNVPGRLVVQMNRLNWWETYGVVEAVTIRGDREIVVTAEGSGEGETFIGTWTFRLSEDGSALTDVDADVVKYRCFGS